VTWRPRWWLQVAYRIWCPVLFTAQCRMTDMRHGDCRVGPKYMEKNWKRNWNYSKSLTMSPLDRGRDFLFIIHRNHCIYPVKLLVKRYKVFFTPTCIWCPHWRWSNWNFIKSLRRQKTKSPRNTVCCHYVTHNVLRVIHTTSYRQAGRQAGRQTDTQST